MKKNVNTTTLKNSDVLNNLPYPKFLAFSFKDWFFEFNNKHLTIKENEQTLTEKLLKTHSQPDTIILFNGNIIFNSAQHLVKAHSFNRGNIAKEFQNYLETPAADKVTYINKCELNSGLVLEFAKKTVVEKLHVVIAGNVNLSHYSYIVVNESANIKVLEEYVLFNNAKLNYSLESQVLNNAKLQWLALQDLKNNSSNAFTHSVHLQQDATLDFNYLNLNSTNVINNSHIKLLGENADANINTITFANKNYNLGSLIVAEHLNKNTNSGIFNVGLVNDNAKLTIDGLNIIEKGNSKSNAEQESKIVNLKDTAQSVANPQLIINEYDVKAGHAAAVGRVDEDQLYYLMSRGLKKHEAIELLVMSFANEYFEKINDKSKVKKVVAIIKNKIK